MYLSRSINSFARRGHRKISIPSLREKRGRPSMREKSLFIDGFAPPSPPMATVLALLLETAATSVRRSKGRVAPFPLIYPPILARDTPPREPPCLGPLACRCGWRTHSGARPRRSIALSRPLSRCCPSTCPYHIACKKKLRGPRILAMNPRSTLVWQAPTPTS